MKISDEDWEYKKTKGTVAFVCLLVILLDALGVFPV